MTRKPIALFIATLLASSLVTASGLEVTGVYYDPVQAENGGEAIQLENTGEQPVDLGDFTLATKSSSIPLPRTSLLPGRGYLLADTGWSTLRDDPAWPDADLEVGLSLANTEGFVEIRTANGSNDTAISALAWNATNKSREGYVFTAAGEMTPSFRNSRSSTTDVPVTMIVLDSPPSIGAITVTDDAPEPGVQLLGYDRTITVTAQVDDANGEGLNVSAQLLGTRVTLTAQGSGLSGTDASGSANETGNATGTLYTGTLTLIEAPWGEHLLVVTAQTAGASATTSVPVMILSTSSVTVSGSPILRGEPGSLASGEFTVTNEGNTGKTVTLTHDIPGGVCDATAFTLAVDASRAVRCSATIPRGPAGTYEYTVRLLVS